MIRGKKRGARALERRRGETRTGEETDHFLQERNGGAEWNWDKALNWGGRIVEI